jgi:glycolate oxidase FAD binding subunit
VSGDLAAPGTAPATRTERPTSVAEAAACLRDTDGTVLFRGAGTSLDWAGRVGATDLVLSSEAMTDVLAHTPADMTAAVQAGTPLAALQERLGAHGQWLALDPPTEGDGATVGGLLAAGDSGPSRLRYGNLRDLVIGVTLVLPDGTVGHSGGHVIKNVAGYDLAKLVHGSLGSLAFVAEVVLRLHPRPQRSVTTVADADVTAAAEATRLLARSSVEPTAVEWVDGEGDEPGRLVVRCTGSPRAVEAAVAQLTRVLEDVGLTPRPVDDGGIDDAEQVWRDLAARVRGTDGDTVLRVATLPSDLEALAAHARAQAGAAGCTVRLSSSVALGVHTLRLSGGTSDATAGAVAAIRQHALDRGGSVMLRRRPRDLDDHLDPLGPPPSSVDLLRRVKAQLDPTGRCAPGRFAPWY